MKRNPTLPYQLAGAVALALTALSPAFGQAAPSAPTDQPAATGTSSPGTAAAPAPTVYQLEAMEVTGERASLASAEEIKEDSQTIEDSIVASDIDKLPDVNVSYALERITGVQVAHIFAGIGGNGAVTIDGLTQVENMIDGREVFTAGGTSGGGVGPGQRTFDYSEVPSALVAGIDVYKSAEADQLDGGLGGSIDVRLHKPFDFNGEEASVTLGSTYAGLDNQTRPNYNVLVSNTENTSVGKIGLLVDFSYQVQPWREDNIGVGNPTASAAAVTGDNAGLIASSYTMAAYGGVFQTTGIDTVLQWQPTQNLNLYAGYNYDEWWNRENQYEMSIGLSNATVVPGSATLFPGSNTNVESASFTNVTGSGFGIIRDLTDRSRLYYIGGTYTSGPLTVKADLSRYDSSYGFYNNGVLSAVTIPSFTYNLGGTIPSGAVTGGSLLNPSSYTLSQVYNRLDPANGYETAGRVDGEYQLGPGSFITSILAGVRYAGTEQDNGTSGLFLGSYSFNSTNNLYSEHPANLIVTQPYQNFFSGYTEVQPVQYLAGNTQNLRNTNEELQAYGDTTTTASNDATINPLSLYHIDESTTAFYLMPKFATNVGGFPLDGNFGVRLVETTDNLDGFQTVTPASLNGGVAVLGPLALNSRYWDVLPSLNARLKLTDKTFLRAAASKTITRPPFNEISPSLTLNANPVTPSLDSGSQGNPNLKPMTSDNVDVTLEQYFNKDTMVYAGLLYKDVQGFPVAFTQPETYGGLVYQVSTYVNLNTATIKGGELGYQEFFTFLPAPFDGLGVQANFTHVDSTTPSSVQGYNIPLTNLSRNSYNLIGMYEKGPFSARLAYNWRDKFVTGVSSFVGVGLLPQFIRSYGDLDASVNYDITKHLELTLQAVNLTNTLRYQYWASPEDPSNLYLDGAVFMASVTYRF